jgi:rRNA pseudouridine-1189 N-methylase Emg1 (Nep1/Mra1 family)
MHGKREAKEIKQTNPNIFYGNLLYFLEQEINNKNKSA